MSRTLATLLAVFETKRPVPHLCNLPSISELAVGLVVWPFHCPRCGLEWHAESYRSVDGLELLGPCWIPSQDDVSPSGEGITAPSWWASSGYPLRLSQGNTGRAGRAMVAAQDPLASSIAQSATSYLGATSRNETQVGQGGQVARDLGRLDGVLSAEQVTGPYDIVLRAEATSLDQLGRLVATGIQGVEGVTRTITCAVVSL